MSAGSEPARPENPNPEVPGGAHDPMRDDVDGDEAMVPRVPNFDPEAQCKIDRRTRVDGTRSVQKLVSPLRCVEGSSARTLLHERMESCQASASIMDSLVVTEKMCCRSCASRVGTVQLDAW